MTDKVNNIVGRIPLTGTSSHFNNNEFHIDQLLGLVRTGTPVQVVAVHVNKDNSLLPPTIDVKPLVQQINGQGTATSHGTIYGIPITRSHAGVSAVINDPVAGDIGSLHIHDRDISTIKSTSKEGAPGSFRRHDLADGVYSGAMLNKTVPTQYLQWNNSDGGLTLKDKFGNQIVTDKDTLTITDKSGNVIKMQSGSIAINGNLTVTGSITAGFGTGDSVTLQHHTHGGGPQPDPGT